jgi:hypothetical protein
MSHHFDTKLAKEDPSLNVCDLYLFRGAPDTTVMAMTVNPDVVLSAPDTLHIEGLYAFRLDLTGDAREDVVFKFRFNEPRHVNGDVTLGHAPEMQVSRWGLPMITHLFLNDPGNQEVKETFNKSAPSEDIALFSGYMADFTQKMVTYAGSVMTRKNTESKWSLDYARTSCPMN